MKCRACQTTMPAENVQLVDFTDLATHVYFHCPKCRRAYQSVIFNFTLVEVAVADHETKALMRALEDGVPA